LVLEVRKLGKESSFLVETKIAQAGIRGTQFKVSASADSAELSVLEGRVDFLDAQQVTNAVETAKKADAVKGVPAELEDMSASEQAEVEQAVEQVKGAAASIDLNRLANTVDGYAPKPNHIVKSALGMELIWCPPGGYVRGPSKKGGNNESPEHPVILTRGFFMGKYEVTQEEYKEVMSKNPSIFRGDKLPVELVSWNDAVAFCEELNKKERKRGWEFALPTEAEWEYACRAGTTTRFSWGDSCSPQFANYSASGFKKTLNVGSYTPNPWGFHDLHGNVNEWTNDFYNLYPNHLVVDPIQIDQTGIKVYRGGSWKLPDIFMRSSWRDFILNPPDYRRNKVHDDVGFRVALKQVD
jgi:formylglycine-generating enzyme required for sulfatase activity